MNPISSSEMKLMKNNSPQLHSLSVLTFYTPTSLSATPFMTPHPPDPSFSLTDRHHHRHYPDPPRIKTHQSEISFFSTAGIPLISPHTWTSPRSPVHAGAGHDVNVCDSDNSGTIIACDGNGLLMQQQPSQVGNESAI